MISRVALIGSNGFIGRHLADRMSKEKNCELLLFGRSPVSANPGTYHQLHQDNSAQLSEKLKGCELVYYLASETIPASSWNNPMLEIEKNLVPFLQVLDAAVKSGVKKLVFLSSAGTIYGPSRIKITEDSNKMPFSPYGITKLSMEYHLNYFRSRHGLQYDVYRISNVFGEGQDTSKGLGIINTFLEQILSGEKIKVFGDGHHTRNYIYVRDVSELLMLSFKLPLTASEIFNLSSNDTLSVNQIVELLKKVVPEKIKTEYVEGRASDNDFIDLDNSKILHRTGDFTFTGIEQAILQTYGHLKKQTKITQK